MSMTKEQQKQFDHIVSEVEKTAVSREASMGKLAIDDFYTGAMAAMIAMGFEMPASWVFGIMRNDREMLGMGKK